MDPIEIRRLDARDVLSAAHWDAFVRAHAHGTFFHLAGWQGVLEQAFGHCTFFLYAVDAEHPLRPVVGVLPLAHVSSLLFGSALTSLPFAVYGGVLADSPTVCQALLGHAERLARALKADHLELRHRQSHRPDWPQQDLYVTFRRALHEREDDNLLAIPRKQRAMVRKGIRNGLTSAVDSPEHPLTDVFFDLYADNVHRHGTPALPGRYFRLLREAFGHDVQILVVHDAQGVPVSSVMSFYFRDEVLPY